MSHGSKANNLYKKALDLDDKNYAAYNAMGVYCLHAPAIGGGGVDKAIENLEKLWKAMTGMKTSSPIFGWERRTKRRKCLVKQRRTLKRRWRSILTANGRKVY